MLNKCCCFSEHREIENVDILKKLLHFETEKMIKKGITKFICGGAIGFDTISAEIVISLKEKYNNIKLIMALPCPEQDKYWRKKDKDIYKEVISNADDVIYISQKYFHGCMFKRNRYMVDNSTCCICYLKKLSGGTFYTVDYAIKHGVSVINLCNKTDFN